MRAATRRPSAAFQKHPKDDWVLLDVQQPETIEPAMEGCSVAYYLVHGMGQGEDYEEVEGRAAERFAEAAARAGLDRIVYLGGVSPSGTPSRHLRSRLRTGSILRAGRVPAVELRAGMIVGFGSESWRIVRDLSARLPAMVLPRWLENRSQPVAIRDVVEALVRAADIPLTGSQFFGLPGPEALSAKEILIRVARLRGTRPVTVGVPFVTPRLSSYWIQLVTRANRDIARELVEGMRSDLVSTEPPFWDLMPDYRLTPFDEAAAAALDEEARGLPPGAKALEWAIRRASVKVSESH